MDVDFPVPTFPVIFRHDDNNDGSASDSDAARNETEVILPAIFTKDPREWTKFVDHNVQILLDDGVQKCGVVHVIDPVSEAVVLVNKVRSDDANSAGKLIIEILPGHVVKDISIVSKADETALKDVERLFGEEAAASGRQMSEEEASLKREEVKNWLIANRIPVEIGGVKGDVIEVAGKALIIKPPYDVDHCFSLNEIILKKVRQLLKNKSES